jgi:dGTPase
MAKTLEVKNLERNVADFIASITDRYAMTLYSKLFLPSPLV